MAALAGQASLSKFCSFDGLRSQRQCGHSTTSSVQCPASSRPSSVVVVAEKKVAKRKQIILTTNVPNVGQQGELLSVRLGFFRNYLFPKGWAKTATPQVLKAIEAERERQEREKQKLLDDARKIARQFQTIGGFIVRRKAGTGKSFFGSVTKLDLVDIIRANTGREISKEDIELPEIKEVGEHIAKVKLHPEVIAELRVNVVGK